jgi:transaldolase
MIGGSTSGSEGDMTTSRLHQLTALGQSVWLDELSRPLVRDGELARLLREDSVTGVTSNPTIFQKAISAGDAYDDQLRRELAEEEDAKQIFLALATADIIAACDVLRPTWESARTARDGWVSLEVDPNLFDDRSGTVEEAELLGRLVDRPNLYVKIPATGAGVGAIEEMISRGRSINVTLIFGLGRYEEVVEAYISGLERLVAAGGDPTRVHSVASFFVSRVDTEADRRLDEIGGHDDLRGRMAVANAKLAYRRYEEIFAGERWEALAARGAVPQPCLWASTSTKDPRYRDVLYVEELIGPNTVNTMPRETLVDFQDHGRAEVTVTRDVDEAHRVLEALQAAGIDYDDVIATLEREGVEKFRDSFRSLLDGIREKRGALAAA